MGTNINDNRTSIENFWLLEFDQQGKNVAVIKRTTIQYQLLQKQ